MKELLRVRHEFKYVLPLPLAETVKSRLSALLSFDSHYADGIYNVRSVYLDDMVSSAYYEKSAGVEKRQKIRVRYYDLDTSYIILEKKIKKGDLIMKRSSVIDEKVALSVVSGNYEPLLFSEDPFLRELYGELVAERYVPAVGVDYMRTAYVMPGTDIRITVDEKVAAFPPSDGFRHFDPPMISASAETAVLEVKYGQYFPTFIISALDGIPLRREAFSKFAICRDLMRDTEV